ncbi:MAG: hypothetical protein FWF46_08005 [Oscillospiraceae bacterium]|nr:hypothetical protein [Oscillospiraceae bacterium]
MNKEKKNKKRSSSLLILLLLLIIAVVTVVYLNSGARYTSSGTDSTTEIQVGQWAVKVNTADIAANESLNGTINLIPMSSADVKKDVMVPGSIAYGDITIDMSGAEVSGTYTVSIDSSATENLTGLKILGFQDINAGDPAVAPASTLDPTATGTIAYSATPDAMIKTVRVFVEWDPIGDADYDAAQTAEGVAAGTQALPVTVTVDQVVPTYN